MGTRSSRAGATTGNLLIVLSVLALGAALLFPTFEKRRFNDRLAAVIAEVESVRSAAVRYHGENRDLPPPSPIGVVPEGLVPMLPPGFSFRSVAYLMQWERFELTEETELPMTSEPDPLVELPDIEVLTAADTLGTPPPAIRSFGGLEVHASESKLLAGLLARYGSQMSFVRDSTWTLLIPLLSGPRNELDPTR